MRKICFFIITMAMLFVTGASSVYAASPEISDFGCTLEAEIPQEAAIASISVPDLVYQCIARPDLGDVRIFSNEGIILPHTVKKPVYGYGESPSPAKLPFFPIYKSKESNGDISMHVETGKNGAVIDVKTSGNHVSGTEKINAWLIDATFIEKNISGLVFELNGASGLVFEITVEAGDDLAHWRKIAGPVTFADLDYGGHRLSRNRADFSLSFVKSKYFRISWPEEAANSGVSSVTAVFPKPGINPEIRWKEFKGRTSEKKISGKTVLEFDTEGFFPVEYVDIYMPDGSGLFHGTLMSRPDLSSEWKQIHTGTFYGLVINGKSIKSGPVRISNITDRFWKFEADQAALHDNKGIPALRTGWIPHDIIFIPGSNKNFIVASGKTGLVHKTGSIVDSILASLSGSKPVKALIFPEKNRNKKFNPPRQSVPVKKWLLWGFLVAGAITVGVMAHRLYRQMGK